MKFKQSVEQYQRIERIRTSHLIIGIDMAKESHVAQATNYRGIVLSNRHLSLKVAKFAAFCFKVPKFLSLTADKNLGTFPTEVSDRRNYAGLQITTDFQPS